MPQPHPEKPILISVYCNKGGVGKTTALHNMAYILSEAMGFKVLVVDADPQCNLSNQLLKIPPNDSEASIDTDDPEELVEAFYQQESALGEQRHIYDCYKPLIHISQMQDAGFLQRADKVQLQATAYNNLFFLPGHIKFSEATPFPETAYLNQAANPETAKILGFLPNYIRKIATINHIDIVLIDLNPSISVLNAAFILGADYFTIPTFPDCFTAQGIGNLCEKIPMWVRGTQFMRAIVNTDIALPAPAKFLGYFSLRFPSRKQPNRKHDVVAAYHKWWDRIHDIVREKLVPSLRTVHALDASALTAYNMISDNFELFRTGVKDFASAGEAALESGYPIADETQGRDKREKDGRHYFYQEFASLAGYLLGNMEPESLRSLGLSDVKNFRITGNIFGAVRTHSVRRAISTRTSSMEGRDFYVYDGSQVESERCNFFGLPIPYRPEMVQKKLRNALIEKNQTVRRHLRDELVEICLRMRTEEIPESIRDPSFVVLLNRLKRAYESEARNITQRYPALFDVDLDWTFEQMYARLSRRSSLTAHEQGCLSDLRRTDGQIRGGRHFKDFQKKCEVQKRCIAYVNDFLLDKQKFNFRIGGDKYDFSERASHLIHAILGALDDTRYSLTIWCEDSATHEIKEIFRYTSPDTPEINALYDAGSGKFSLMIERVDRLELEPQPDSLGDIPFSQDDSQPEEGEIRFSQEHSPRGRSTSVACVREGLFGTGTPSDPRRLRMQALLKRSLPETGYEPGVAVADGDCFFDSVAQALNKRQNSQAFTVASLRRLCADYAKDLERKYPVATIQPNAMDRAANWIFQSLRRQTALYQKYLIQSAYTAAEARLLKEQYKIGDGLALWGEQAIDAVIICKRFNIKIHIIELHEELLDRRNLPSILHQLIDSNGVHPLEAIDDGIYHDINTTHVAVGYNHFCPILETTGLVPRGEHSSSGRGHKRRPEEGERERSDRPSSRPRTEPGGDSRFFGGGRPPHGGGPSAGTASSAGASRPPAR